MGKVVRPAGWPHSAEKPIRTDMDDKKKRQSMIVYLIIAIALEIGRASCRERV